MHADQSIKNQDGGHEIIIIIKSIVETKLTKEFSPVHLVSAATVKLVHIHALLAVFVGLILIVGRN